MKSSQSILKRDIRVTPDEDALPQSFLDEVRQKFHERHSTRPDGDDDVCQVVIAADKYGGGNAGPYLEHTHDGYVIVMPVGYLATISWLGLALSPFAAYYAELPSVGVSMQETNKISQAVRRQVINATAKRLDLTAAEILAAEREAELEHISSDDGDPSKRLLDRLLHASTDAEIFESIWALGRRLSLDSSQSFASAWAQVAVHSLLFSVDHEGAHVWHGHMEILRDFSDEDRESYEPESIHRAYRMLHELARSRVTTESGWPSEQSESYREWWNHVKEFQADWRALQARLRLELGRSCGLIEPTAGDKVNPYDAVKRVLWGAFVTFGLIYLHDCIETRLGMSTLVRDERLEPLKHPDAIMRLAALIARMSVYLPFGFDWQREAVRYLKAVGDVADRLGWDGFRALGGVVLVLLDLGGLEIGGLSEWVADLEREDKKAQLALEQPSPLKRGPLPPDFTGRFDHAAMREWFLR